jgi:hypothetical protein
MADRKPQGETFESFVDRKIREAMEEGAFKDLPGKGKPIPDLDKPLDEMWWLKAYLKREGLSVLPESLTLRRDVEVELEQASGEKSETRLRKKLLALNARIARHNRTNLAGPATTMGTIDVEKFILYWRSRRG